MSSVDAWRCQWPTKRALAVAEGLGEPLEPETFPGLEVAVPIGEDAAVVALAPVVADVPVPDVFFEHPAAATVTITVAAMATTNPGLTTEAFVVIRLSLQSLNNHAAGAVNRWNTPQRLSRLVTTWK
jgi:hypothetical protein